jgi:solute carrier family 25 citrate transporter 1
LGLYKGLGAVVTGIVPKMAIRFMSYEYYKNMMADKATGATSSKGIFVGEVLAQREAAVQAWES